MEMEKKTHYDTLETMHGTFQTTLTKKYLARKPWVPNNPKHTSRPFRARLSRSA